MHHLTSPLRIGVRRALVGAAVACVAALAIAATASQSASASTTHPWLKLSFVHSGLVLNSAGGTTNVGAPIIQWPFNPDHYNSQWEMNRRGSVGYEMVNRLSRQCIDVPSKDIGAQLEQRPCDGTLSQRWEYDTTPANASYSVLKNRWSQLVINQAGAVQDFGGAVIQWPRANTTNERLVTSLVTREDV